MKFVTFINVEFGILYRPCQTEKLPISGGEFKDTREYESKLQAFIKQGIEMGLHESIARKIASTYGTNTVKLFSIILEKNSKK